MRYVGLIIFLVILTMAFVVVIKAMNANKPKPLTNHERDELKIYRAFFTQIQNDAITHSLLDGGPLVTIVMDECTKTRKQIDNLN